MSDVAGRGSPWMKWIIGGVVALGVVALGVALYFAFKQRPLELEAARELTSADLRSPQANVFQTRKDIVGVNQPSTNPLSALPGASVNALSNSQNVQIPIRPVSSAPDNRITNLPAFQQWNNIPNTNGAQESAQANTKRELALGLLTTAYPSLNTAILNQLSNEEINALIRINRINLTQHPSYPTLAMIPRNRWNEQTRMMTNQLLSTSVGVVRPTFWQQLTYEQLWDILGINNENRIQPTVSKPYSNIPVNIVTGRSRARGRRF